MLSKMDIGTMRMQICSDWEHAFAYGYSKNKLSVHELAVEIENTDSQ